MLRLLYTFTLAIASVGLVSATNAERQVAKQMLQDVGPLTTAEQKQKLTASDGAAGDLFGFSVSVSGNVAIVGARQDDDKGAESGSAYLYEKSITSGLWELKQKLTASDGAADDRFGTSVSVSGTVAIVGARYDDGKGSAHLYEKNNTSGLWELKTKLTASDGAGGDWFGASVSVSGNVAIVGAPNDDGKGSAHLYEKNNTSGLWELKQKLTASDGAADDWFGRSVSVSGNVAIVSAPNDDVYSGSAHLYEKNITSGLWELKQKLTASDGTVDDYFGDSVSVSGNVAIVGAPNDDDKGIDSGSAYLYEKSITSGLWELKTKLTASDGAAGDLFGFSVSVSGNVAIVGVIGDDDKGDESGSAYLYVKSITSGLWELKQKLTASDGAVGDWFGHSVSVSGNVAIVGAPYDGDKGTDSGSVYAFGWNPTAAPTPATTPAPTPAPTPPMPNRTKAKTSKVKAKASKVSD